MMEQQTKQWIMIAMGGTFSPMHLGHVSALEASAEAVLELVTDKEQYYLDEEKEEDGCFRFLAPAPDGYGRAKQKRQKSQDPSSLSVSGIA
jgi:hypothetical protein